MLVLDAGAGKGPYRALFDHARYEAADFAQLPSKYTALDYVCSLEDIPVEDDRFDRILFNQVLEHIDKPADVLAELYRVTKPGGKILCSCPLFFEEHMKPWDYYRYTQFALKKLFGEAGFVNVRVRWLEGYYGTVAYQFHQMYRWLPRDVSGVAGTRRQKLYLKALVWGTRNLAWFLRNAFARADLRWKHTKTGMPKNYVVLADKPE
jgi:ubiquinone/menaquinone biosynthesis C-methylase UbiE